ncbi:MAG: tetratricopeptide repeat protein [bacterium]
MKIKPLYIYITGFILIIVLLVVFTSGGDKPVDGKTAMEKQMPDDDVHKGMNMDGNDQPSKSNVIEAARQRMDSLRLEFEKNPDDTVTVKRYAEMLSAGHQPDKALELLQSILKKDSKRVDILLAVTFVYYNQRDFQKAEEYTNKVLAIDKNHHEANYNLGAIAAAKGENDRAKRIWQDVIKKYPGTDVAKLAESSLQQL